MSLCPFCEHPNRPGTERCESCGAWMVQGDGSSPEKATVEESAASPGPDGGGDDLEGQILSLMAEGRKIEAIKIYREATGAGLKEAKDAVESLELRFGGPQPLPGALDFQPELLKLLGRGEKIGAIKLYRERTGVGLKEAKEGRRGAGSPAWCCAEDVGLCRLRRSDLPHLWNLVWRAVPRLSGLARFHNSPTPPTRHGPSCIRIPTTCRRLRRSRPRSKGLCWLNTPPFYPQRSAASRRRRTVGGSRGTIRAPAADRRGTGRPSAA